LIVIVTCVVEGSTSIFLSDGRSSQIAGPGDVAEKIDHRPDRLIVEGDGGQRLVEHLLRRLGLFLGTRARRGGEQQEGREHDRVG
jgi:hypothetical protein